MSSGSSQTQTTLKRKSGDTRVSAEDLFLGAEYCYLQSAFPGSQILLSNWHFSASTRSSAPYELG